MPLGPRKSGMPDSVEMPAPVSATTRRASRSHPAISFRSVAPRLFTAERGYAPVGSGRFGGKFRTKAVCGGMFDGYRTFLGGMTTSLATPSPTPQAAPAEIRSGDYDRRWWVL